MKSRKEAAEEELGGLFFLCAGDFYLRVATFRLLCALPCAAFVLAMTLESHAQPYVLEGPNFLVVDGASGVEGCLPRDSAKRALRDRVLDVNERVALDPDLGVVFSLEVPPCADLFYAAVSNDVRGIGYQHFYEEELFDESPGAALQGVAFLNDVPYWETHPSELRRAFLHELGHRWGARVQVAGQEPTAILGRDDEHWSYFLHSSRAGGASPLEGNRWVQAGAAHHTETDGAPSLYSELDLYLMGLLSADEVGPLLLLQTSDEEVLPLDCRGVPLQPSSPPQRCSDVEILATTTTFSIDDVIEVEGSREPSASGAIEARSVAFYFYTTEGRLELEQCQHWSSEVDALIEAFAVATDGRMVLENSLSEGPDCRRLLESIEARRPADERVGSSGCSLGPVLRPGVVPAGVARPVRGRHSRSGPRFPSIYLGFALVALVVGRARRRHKKVPG